MGNRSNIRVDHYDATPIYLYSHWDGERIIESAVAGLESNRIGDPAYLARIIFQHMLRNEELGEETGYGISPFIEDNEHPILRITADGFVTFEEGDDPELLVPYKSFLEVLEGIEDWRDAADADSLYDVLIPLLAQKMKG